MGLLGLVLWGTWLSRRPAVSEVEPSSAVSAPPAASPSAARPVSWVATPRPPPEAPVPSVDPAELVPARLFEPGPGLCRTPPDALSIQLAKDKALVDYRLTATGSFLVKQASGKVGKGGRIPWPAGAEMVCLRYTVSGEDGSFLAAGTGLWRRHPGPHLSSSRACSHVLAVGGDGSLWSWGQNDLWQLGYNVEKSSSFAVARQETPRRVKRIKEKVVEAVAAYGYSLALTEDGGVYQFGEDRLANGGYGHGTMPQRIASLDGCHVVKIFNYAYGGLALGADGTVWGWGSMSTPPWKVAKLDFGYAGTDRRIPLRLGCLPDQYGDRRNKLEDLPFLWSDGGLGREGGGWFLPAEILAGRQPVAQLFGGDMFELSILNDGSVWQYDRRRPGSAAAPGVDNGDPNPFLVNPDGAPPVRMALTPAAYVMLCQDGKLWACGNHSFGGMTGGKTNTVAPVPFQWPADRSPVVDLVAWNGAPGGFANLVVLCRDGSLWASNPWPGLNRPGGEVAPMGASGDFYQCPEYRLPMGEGMP